MAQTPRSKSVKSAQQAAAAAASSALGGGNLGDDNDGFTPPLPADIAAQIVTHTADKPAKAARGRAKTDVSALPPEQQVMFAPRLWIILDDNDEIPPGGQFIGVNGAAFLLVPGQEAWVPEGICDVLDHAIKSVPVIDELTRQVKYYKDRPRFSYRVVRNKPAPEGWVQPE